MSEKLTEAQRRMLTAALRSGGVLGFGQHFKIQERLRARGLLSANKDKAGYFNITDAGRAALTNEPG